MAMKGSLKMHIHDEKKLLPDALQERVNCLRNKGLWNAVYCLITEYVNSLKDKTLEENSPFSS